MAKHIIEEKQPGCMQKSLTCTQLKKKEDNPEKKKVNKIFTNRSTEEKTHGEQIAHEK